MKVKLFIFTLLTLICVSAQSQLFQEHLQIPGNYFHEVCTDQLNSSSEDLIIAGNFYDSTLMNPMMELIRIDDITGNLVWQHTYFDPASFYKDVHLFDMVAYSSSDEDMLALTGSVSILDTNYLFIVKIDENGNFVTGFYYKNLVAGAIHSQGLSIIYAQQGFVVGGFTNMDYNHGTNDIRTGFVIRVDMNLNPTWTKNVSSFHPTANDDFDMVSDVTETADGFFITGSVTSMTTFTQQAVLCLKLDFNGNVQWMNSYLYGNSRDLGVDAYYNASSDEIFLLANYSASHYFGVTVLDNNTGIIDPSRSWQAYDWDNLNRYGFTIIESNDTLNLVVAGYIRDGLYMDEDNNMIFSQTIPFVYEFEKLSGDQIGSNFFYNVPFTDPGFSNYFDFWYFQMPLIYYPDMALKLSNGSGYFLTGFRSDSLNGFTDVEFIKTDITHKSECYQTPVILLHNLIQPVSVTTDTNNSNPTHYAFALTQSTYDYVLDSSCTAQPISCLCDSLPAAVAAGFSHVGTGLTIDFQPYSLNVNCDSVEWNFGDNSTANSQGNQQVSHTYSISGSYMVCMKVTRYSNDGTVCTDSICKIIDISTVGIIQQNNPGIMIYPNPAKDQINVRIINQHTTSQYMIFNSLGLKVDEGSLNDGISVINVSSLNQGIYFIRIVYNDQSIVKKILID